LIVQPVAGDLVRRADVCRLVCRQAANREIEIAVPVFGCKSHVGIERKRGFLRRYDLRPQFQHKKPRGKNMPAHLVRGNARLNGADNKPSWHFLAAKKCSTRKRTRARVYIDG
jgi:hypothetical protein